MRTIGFVISEKENERRRAILPHHLGRVKHRDQLVFETGYGAPFGLEDDAYRAAGARVESRDAAYDCDIICNPKAPEPAERDRFRTKQTLFGWVHAVQGRETVDFLLDRDMTAIAWEDMFEGGRHVFWRNNEIAGEAAVVHAVNFGGRLLDGTSSAVIGTGTCARGALRALSRLGSVARIYDRHTIGLLRGELGELDVLVNAILWDVFRTDHLVYRSDLARMRPGSLIIDVSCDEAMGIESSRPTTIADPVYTVDGIVHYVVDHTPALYFRTATDAVGAALAPYLDELVEERPGECLQAATVIDEGRIMDERIRKFQQR